MITPVPLSPDDWRLWRELRLAALAEAPSAFGSTLADWTGAGDTEQRWRARLMSTPLNVVLRLDDRRVGMVSATTPGTDGVVELIGLWAAPSARGRGVGDAAIDAVLSWAQATYADAGVALSVKSDNEPALRLYRRHGFIDAGISPDDPSERWMRRSEPY